jgi:glycine dehydrogenase subunit 1
MICRLTGMDVSNASHYDGATSCAEAAALAIAETKQKEILYSAGLHPEYVQVLNTYFRNGETAILKEIPLENGITSLKELQKSLSKETAAVIIQNPNCLGFIEMAEEIGEIIKDAKLKTFYVIAVNEPHSLSILKNPGDCGADIAVGEGAGLGIPLSFGGPYLGFMAVRNKLLRKIPGRLVGQTVDADGNEAFCLTLQTREQHIRREKASSNICSNEALCALAATVYLAYIGRNGFAAIGKRCVEKSHYLRDRLLSVGFKLIANAPFFNEFTMKCPDDPVKIERFLRDKGITSGFKAKLWKGEWKDYMIFCATEVNSKKEIDDMIGYLETYCREEVSSACAIN